MSRRYVLTTTAVMIFDSEVEARAVGDGLRAGITHIAKMEKVTTMLTGAIEIHEDEPEESVKPRSDVN